MEKQYYNLVFVKHENNEKNYLFQAPMQNRLKAGEKVFVDTIQGESMGECKSDSFIVDNFTAEQIISGTRAYKPIKDVIGYAEKQTGYRCVYFGLIDCPF